MNILFKTAGMILTLVLLGNCVGRSPAGPATVELSIFLNQVNPSDCEAARGKDASWASLAEAEDLLNQGLIKRAKGDPIGAQKLLNCALVSLERTLSDKAVLKVETGIWDVSAAAWSADGTKLMVASGKNIHVLHAERGARVLNLQTENGPISTLAIQPDSNILASGAPHHNVELWGLGASNYGTKLGTLEYSDGDLQTLVFSPDGKTLAGRTWESASSKLWNVESRQPLRVLDAIDRHQVVLGVRGGDQGGPWPAMLAFSPDGALLLAVHDRTIAVWNLRGQKLEGARIIPTPTLADEAFASTVFHPNGRQFATGTESGKLVMLSLTGGSPRVVEAHRTRPQLVFSPDGERILSASSDGSARAYATKTLKPLGLAQVTLPYVEAVAPHPDTQRAAFVGEGRIHIADVTTKNHVEVIHPPIALSAISMSQSGATLAFGTPSGTLVLLSLRDGSFVWLHGHTEKVTSLSFSPDGQSLVSVSLDKTARLWDLRTHKTIRVYNHSQGLHSVAFRPDGQVFATAGEVGLIQVWNTQSGNLLASPKGMVCAVGSLSFSADGKRLLANASDHSIAHWDANDYRAISRYQGGQGCVGEVQNSSPTLGMVHGGSLIASAPGGNTIEILNALTGQIQQTLTANGLVQSLAVHPKEAVLAAAIGAEIHRWTLSDGKKLSVLTTTDPSLKVDALTFSADGRFLIGTSRRGAATVWSMSSETLLLTLRWTNESSAFVETPQGLADWFGSEKPALFCQIGVRIYPRELCEDRARRPGLLTTIFRQNQPN